MNIGIELTVMPRSPVMNRKRARRAVSHPTDFMDDSKTLMILEHIKRL